MHFTLSLALASSVAAYPPFKVSRAAEYQGVATFNSYDSQETTNCGPKAGNGGAYGAATGDVSLNIGGGICSGTIDQSQCNGQGAVAGYKGPICPKRNCGKCYRVTNAGGIEGAAIGGIGNTITVQIIDSCPASSAWNYCKTDIPANQRCGDASTNTLDIDQSAYMALTGRAWENSPNLAITIAEDPECGSGQAPDVQSAAAASPAPQTPAAQSPAVQSPSTNLPAAQSQLAQLSAEQLDAQQPAVSNPQPSGVIAQSGSKSYGSIPAAQPAANSVPAAQAVTCPVLSFNRTAAGGSRPGAGACGGIFSQCGGSRWKGPTCCTLGLTCKVQNSCYSQCF